MNKRHTSHIPVSKLPKGPNGRALCRICNTEVPKGRRSYCSESCQIDGECMWSGELARRHTFKRDKGVCALCGVDTDQIAREYHEARKAVRSDVAKDVAFRKMIEVLRAQGYNVDRWTTRSFWEMDHIVPVVEGGGACGIANLRTLCTPCHKRVTAELAARRAAEKRGDDPGTARVKRRKRSSQLALPLNEGDR